jgi:tetratricopeptide (TPR) repeat protein
VELRLAEAIRLREIGEVEQAQIILLELHHESPDDPAINYQCAWVHDKLGLESEAVPFYVSAIAGGLEPDDLRGALLGLGSTYRAIGQYERAVETLRRGTNEFPDAAEFPVFLAMALYNVDRHNEAMQLLLRGLAASADGGIQRLREAILFYADHLDDVWS